MYARASSNQNNLVVTPQGLVLSAFGPRCAWWALVYLRAWRRRVGERESDGWGERVRERTLRLSASVSIHPNSSFADLHTHLTLPSTTDISSSAIM